ncbi:MAG: hypothetical protein U1F18_02965 [Steroidobacteraceae bacterium]|jgi:hypothetical protein
MRRRRTFDDHGRPIVEVESDTGTFRQEIDTARVRELRGDLFSLEDTQPLRWPSRPSTPEYAPQTKRDGVAQPRRSGLDRLRALSEEIKRRRRDTGGGDGGGGD